MLVTKFFENQEVFITGGSGFIGKALIEKLLRSCPGIGKIFLLLRGKKGKSCEDRLREILNSKLFDTLRKVNPEILHRVYAIDGNCSELGLGISAEDLEKIKNVAVIYHSAASVRFDDALRDAVLLNTRGTFELVKIAETLKNLKAFVHVSTTYCNPDKRVVEEQVYPPYADWRTTIKLAETYSTETLNIFNLKYSNFQPNTYTFTKSLAEQIIQDYKDKLPVVIFRPSIVISTLNEPVPGWVDNFNGPVGLLVACGAGIMRTSSGKPDTIIDVVPVDIVVKAMIIAGYQKGVEGHNPKGDNHLNVYNCATANISPITIGEIIEIGKKYIRKNPMEKTLWIPGGSITPCPVWNFIRFFTFHIMMALLVDCALRLGGGKPFLLRLQRRIYAANLALFYFFSNFWLFKNEHFFSLDAKIPREEYDEFAFLRYACVDQVEFLKKAIRGAKEFLLNESPDSSKGAHLRMTIFKTITWIIQITFAVFVTRFMLRYLYKLYYSYV